VVKDGNSYILTETGAIIRRYVARKQSFWLMYQRRVAAFVLYAILLVRVSGARRKNRDERIRRAELFRQAVLGGLRMWLERLSIVGYLTWFAHGQLYGN